MGIGFHVETSELFDGDTHTYTYLISEEVAWKIRGSYKVLMYFEKQMALRGCILTASTIDSAGTIKL